MSDADMQMPTPEPSASGPPGEDKRVVAQRTLTELLALMDVPATLDIKDATDGGLSVAVQLGVEVPGVAAGRRSHFVDALQFLVNKLVNRPGTERRWVSLAVGGHPEPRGTKSQKPPAREQPVAPAASPAPARPPAPLPKVGRPPREQMPRGKGPAAPSEADERSLAAPEDALLEKAARALAEKSAQLGRYYALVTLSADERAQVMRGSAGVAGTQLSAEGEGRNRRVLFTPEKPAPMPKRSLPVDDDELDD